MAHWWQEPFRLVQTNLRLIDVRRDPADLVNDVQQLGGNALMVNAGGIYAFYPTELPYHVRNPFLGGDFLGEVVRRAHDAGLKVIARCDFSKQHKALYDTHPDWFVLTPEGAPEIYNGLYQTCLSGPYYQERSFEILREILDRYEVDGLFINMFGYQVRNYSGDPFGPCQCPWCARRFRELHSTALPRREAPNESGYETLKVFRERMTASLRGRFLDVIKARRPGACWLGGDVPISEINRGGGDSEPLWTYRSGELARLSAPERTGVPPVIHVTYFLDIFHRFAAEPPPLTGLSLAQAMAYGGTPSLYVMGTLAQEDPKGLDVARELFAFHARHANIFTSSRSAARIALVQPARPAPDDPGSEVLKAEVRGWYLALTHHHLPFDLLPDDALTDDALTPYAVCVLPDASRLSDAHLATLDGYVESGGALIATGRTSRCEPNGPPRRGFGLEALPAHPLDVRRSSADMRAAYFRVKGDEGLPGLGGPTLIPCIGRFDPVEPREGARTLLSLIPPHAFGPPELCFWENESELAGVLIGNHGEGRCAFVPWEPGRQYMEAGRPEHAQLMAGLIRHVAATAAPFETDAPPQLELVLRASGAGRTLVLHALNHSGCTHHSVMDPIPIQGVSVRLEVPGPVDDVYSAALDTHLFHEEEGGRTHFTLPVVEHYEVVRVTCGTGVATR